MASLPVRIASSFLLKMQLIVSVNRRSSEVSTALVEGFVSVLDELLVPSVAFEGELYEKVTRALVGVDLLEFPLGIFEMELIELFSE